MSVFKLEKKENEEPLEMFLEDNKAGGINIVAQKKSMGQEQVLVSFTNEGELFLFPVQKWAKDSGVIVDPKDGTILTTVIK